MQNSHERHTTFHEQWFLVEELKPQLRPEVEVRRQIFEGELWYILSDPDSNSHFRLAKNAYGFVAMLDGKKTVHEVWEICQENSRLSHEDILVQSEVITLLGMLHSSSLLLLDIPADTNILLQKTQQKKLKKIGSTLSSFLFLRIPLLTPDAFFSKFQKIGAIPFTKLGFIIWLIFGFFALRSLIINWNTFASESSQTLVASNLIWLYLVIIITKIVHECGHAFACKYFSAKDGLSGDVHSMGIMLLLFAPVPYIDVSSSVQLRSRFARAAVAMAGMYCEFFVAFVSMLVWANTSTETALHILARNCVILTSITTLLFNINPLLRFDGYFVLSDLLNLPNLYQRSQAYVVYIFKRYILGITKAITNVEKRKEKIIYVIYAIGAFIYRIIITVGIYLILKGNLALLGTILALSLIMLWFGIPIIKGIIYLFSSDELSGMRHIALFRFYGLLAILSFGLLVIPMESSVIVEGIAESRKQYIIYSEVEGTLIDFAKTDTVVNKGKTILIKIDNPGLVAEFEDMQLGEKVTRAKLEHSQDQGDIDSVGRFALELQANRQNLATLSSQVEKQIIFSPTDGVWVAPDLTSREGRWIGKGDVLGSIYSPEDLRLRIAVDQFDAARLFSEQIMSTEFVISERMDIRNKENRLFSANIEATAVPAGRKELFHPSLSVQGGGEIQTIQTQSGEETTEHFFELRLLPEQEAIAHIAPGQKVFVRLVFGKQTLFTQWLRRFRQFFTA